MDHTLLKADATPRAVRTLVEEAVQYGFAAVCVNSGMVGEAVRHARGMARGMRQRGASPETSAELRRAESLTVCSVVGFPLGACGTPVKVAETEYAIDQGAREIDMVITVGMLKEGMLAEVLKDITDVVAACKRKEEQLGLQQPVICKVILETCLLTDEEKCTASRLAMAAGAEYVKTSTGFSTGGATASDVRLMVDAVEPFGGKVKASGGMRTLADAKTMLEAGADRLGVSRGVAMVHEEEREVASELRKS